MGSPRHGVSSPGGSSLKDQLERARQVLDGGVQAFEQRLRARRDAGRAENFQGFGAALHEHLVEEQEGQAAEMVAVAMADDHRVDARDGKPAAFEGQRGIRAAIEQQAAFGGFEEVGAMEAPARAECVAAADDCQFHDAPLLPARVVPEMPPALSGTVTNAGACPSPRIASQALG